MRLLTVMSKPNGFSDDLVKFLSKCVRLGTICLCIFALFCVVPTP